MVWFLCRFCDFRIDSDKVFAARLKDYISGLTCPMCKEKGNEQHPAICMLLHPDIKKIEKNPYLKRLEKKLAKRKDESP